MVRTDEDKIFKSPIIVILGGKEYEIAPLVIKEAREWRKQAVKLLSSLPKYINTTTDDEEGFEAAMSAMILDLPDQMTDLFFAYAKNLDREEIESTASELELAKAIEEVMAVAFPLLSTMTGALGKMVR